MSLPRGWHFPRLLAHRGGGTLAPENTLAGFEAAYHHGFRAVEFDVMLTADGVPVLIHDEEFGRTIPLQGHVAETDYATLRQQDAGGWLDPRFAGEPVPTLSEALDWLGRQGLWANVEIKPARGKEAKTGEVVAAAVAAWQRQTQSFPPLLLSSFSQHALQSARAVAPDLPRAWLVEQVPVDWMQQLQTLDCIALHCDYRHVGTACIAAVKAAGYGLMCYTVNSIEHAQALLRAGVDAICTDRLDLCQHFAGQM